MKDNIVLTGMPASGKSTLGVLLAKQLGYDFLDTDLLLQRRAGKVLAALLAEDGIDAFLRLENEVLSEVDVHRTVIATGGSAVYHAQGMRHMQGIGHIVYLEVPYSYLTARLGDLSARGVVCRPGQSLSQLYAERTALYERYAAYIFHETDGERERSLDENVIRLVAEMKTFLGMQ